jgi:hypothetical protein
MTSLPGPGTSTTRVSRAFGSENGRMMGREGVAIVEILGVGESRIGAARPS